MTSQVAKGFLLGFRIHFWNFECDFMNEKQQNQGDFMKRNDVVCYVVCI
jgi:hypothetical protein